MKLKKERKEKRLLESGKVHKMTKITRKKKTIFEIDNTNKAFIRKYKHN
jgi:hypothetical protein